MNGISDEVASQLIVFALGFIGAGAVAMLSSIYLAYRLGRSIAERESIVQLLNRFMGGEPGPVKK